MRRIILLVAFFLPLAQVAGQGEKASATKPAPAGATVEISEGKAWLIADGKTTLLKEEVRIGTTRVSPDGNAVLKDGTRLRLKNGDKVNEKGDLQKVPGKIQETPVPVTPDNKL